MICEKPLASNIQEVEAAIQLARDNQVVLFEAFKTASLPNFLLLQQSLPKIGKVRKAFINYCQYSSRYQRYLDGENPNTFNPAFSNGSIMDIGFYCLASAVALWGEPHGVTATASLLESGVDAHGIVVLDYGDFSVTLQHSKVSDSVLPSEIQGEAGSLVIEKISECQKLSIVPRGGKAQELTQPQHINTMLYEAEVFARLVEDNEVNHLAGGQPHHGETANRDPPSNRRGFPCRWRGRRSYRVKLCNETVQTIDEITGLTYFVTCKGSNFLAGGSSLRCVQNRIRSPGNQKPVFLVVSETLPEGEVYA